jgi:uncharacterized iron-regulated protein
MGVQTFIEKGRCGIPSRIAALSLLVARQGPPALLNIQTWQNPGLARALDIGMIRNIDSGQLLTARQLGERLAAAPCVLVGEQHGNPDHQALQLWLLQVLGDRRPQGSLLFEMLAPAQQGSVDAAHADIRAANYPADLPAALQWRSHWDWSVYGPVMRFALSQACPLLAADLDAAEAGPEGRPTPAASRQRLQHMARSLLAAPTPAMLFAGSELVRKATGVPLHMMELDATRTPVVLLLAQLGDAIAPGAADYVWYTAALPDPLSR